VASEQSSGEDDCTDHSVLSSGDSQLVDPHSISHSSSSHQQHHAAVQIYSFTGFSVQYLLVKE
jgi:hypothetical protein